MSGHLLLVGFMGAGKSTVGRILARQLGRPFVDLDERIELATGIPIPQLFATEGEAAFRRLESAELERLDNEPPAVVSCGGGVVLSEANRRSLRRLGTVVHLEVDAPTVTERVHPTGDRPLLQGLDAHGVERLMAARRRLYEEVADVSVPTVGRAPEDVAEDIIARLEEASG